MRPPLFRFVLILAFIWAGCAGLKPPAQVKAPDEPAEHLIAGLRQQNSGLETLKGVGRYKTRRGNKSFSGRVAWMVQPPDRFRIEVMSAPGQVIMSLANDGIRLRLRDLVGGKQYEKSAESDLLQDLMSLAMTPRDFVGLLAGRLPIRDYKSATTQKAPETGGYQIRLDNGFFKGRQLIHLAPDMLTVTGYERLSADGRTTLRIQTAAPKRIQDYQIFFHVAVSDSDAQLVLDMDRVWVNIPVNRSAFSLDDTP